jgi:hydroxybutyrate-dimer hydrolase
MLLLCGSALVGAAQRTTYDGVNDDLLSAGLGVEGLRGATPAFVDPLRPGARELRRRAIWQNYRALIDLAPGGGAGELFGPRRDERIAGVEYLDVSVAPDGAGSHTVLLQIPAGFDARRPCMVVVASSGSRGIYGALPTAGEWGLRKGCAVAHTDKGTGARVEDVVLARHAHSGINVEARWGEYLIDTARVAFGWLNQEFATTLPAPLGPANTLVIASGISNGGGVVLRALERDRAAPRERWFDAAVVIEPNVAVWTSTPRLRLDEGSVPRDLESRPLLDYTSLSALLQPCAVLAEPEVAAAQALTPPARGMLAAWCADLAAAGDIRGATLAAQADDARARLLAAGIRADALRLGYQNWLTRVLPSIVVTYASAYARLQPGELPCGYGFSAVGGDGRPRALEPQEWARLFSDSNGLPPTAGIELVRDDGTGAGRNVAAAYTPAALRCMRGLVTGAAGDPALAARIAAGLRETGMRAEPGDRPVIVLHGRGDGLVAVNHSSRAWYAAAVQSRRGAEGSLRYREVVDAQHFDAFLGLPGFATRYVPMQPYLLAAMDEMYGHLAHGAPLAPSQVLRSVPRSARADGGVEALALRHLGALRARPSATDRIRVTRGVLHVRE